MLARASQSSRFIDAAIATAARRSDVFDLLVDVGLGSGTVPLPLAWAVVKAWARGGRDDRAGPSGRDQTRVTRVSSVA